MVVANASTLPSGIFQWYAADNGVVLTAGKVSQWRDLSGNNFHLSAVNTGPDLVANVIANGTLPAVRFSGTTAGLRVTNASASVASPYTMFIVNRYQSNTRPAGVLLHSQDRVRYVRCVWVFSLPWSPNVTMCPLLLPLLRCRRFGTPRDSSVRSSLFAVGAVSSVCLWLTCVRTGLVPPRAVWAGTLTTLAAAAG